MSIKGANGVSDTTPGTVAVELKHIGTGCNIALGSRNQTFFAKPGVRTVIVVPITEARNIGGTIITSPDVDLDFSK